MKFNQKAFDAPDPQPPQEGMIGKFLDYLETPLRKSYPNTVGKLASELEKPSAPGSTPVQIRSTGKPVYQSRPTPVDRIAANATPLTVANTAALAAGGPVAALANAAMGVEGAREALNSKNTTGQRVMGGVNAGMGALGVGLEAHGANPFSWLGSMARGRNEAAPVADATSKVADALEASMGKPRIDVPRVVTKGGTMEGGLPPVAAVTKTDETPGAVNEALQKARAESGPTDPNATALPGSQGNITDLDTGIDQASAVAKANRKINETARKADNALLRKEQAADLQNTRQTMGGTDIGSIERGAAKAQGQAEDMAAKAAAQAEKERKAAEDAQAIQDQIEGQGLIRGTSKVSETVRDPETGLSMRTPYNPPKPPEGGTEDEINAATGGGATGAAAEEPTVTQPGGASTASEPVQPGAEGSESRGPIDTAVKTIKKGQKPATMAEFEAQASQIADQADADLAQKAADSKLRANAVQGMGEGLAQAEAEKAAAAAAPEAPAAAEAAAEAEPEEPEVKATEAQPEPEQGPAQGAPAGAAPIAQLPTNEEAGVNTRFITKTGAAGANYGMAKQAAAAGEIPTAAYARDSNLIENGLNPEGPLLDTSRMSPETAAQVNEAVRQLKDPKTPSNMRAMLMDFIKSNQAQATFDPKTLQMMAAMGIGGYGGYNSKTLNQMTGSPLLSALIGAGGGAAFAGLLNQGPAFDRWANLNLRPQSVDNAINSLTDLEVPSMLGTHAAQVKTLNDIGNVPEAMLDNPQYAGSIARGMTNIPNRAKDFAAGFNAPVQPGASAVRRLMRSNYNPLGYIPRTLTGITNAFQGGYREAGLPRDLAEYYTTANQPKYPVTKAVYDTLGKAPLLRNWVAIRKVPINLIERAYERSPLALASYMSTTNPVEKALIRQRMLRGMAASNLAYNATPDNFVKEHPYAAGLTAAATGPYMGVVAPAMAGRQLIKGQSDFSWPAAMSTMIRDWPWARGLEDIRGGPLTIGRNYLSRYTGALRSPAEAFDPADPNTPVSQRFLNAALGGGKPREIYTPTKDDPMLERLLMRMASNVPGLRNELPGKYGPEAGYDPRQLAPTVEQRSGEYDPRKLWQDAAATEAATEEYDPRKLWNK